jgi:hypothetical protein
MTTTIEDHLMSPPPVPRAPDASLQISKKQNEARNVQGCRDVLVSWIIIDSAAAVRASADFGALPTV